MKIILNYKFMMLMVAVLSSTSLHFTTYAKETELGPAAKFFTDMPLEVMELINRSHRLDMLDYYAADSIAEVPNGMEGFSRLIKVTPDYLKVQITPESTMSISVIPAKPDTIYQCIYSIGKEGIANDSELRFYTSDFVQLPTQKLIQAPVLTDFINIHTIPGKERKEITRQLESMIPFTSITYETDSGSPVVTAHLTSHALIKSPETDKYMQYLKPTINFIWTGKKYKLQSSSK